MSKGYGKYKKASVQSANQEKILLMLYEGAIRFIKQAKVACENNKIKEKGELIGRAYDIVMELATTLDFKVGGEIAVNLEQLYIYVLEELTRANITSNTKHLDNALSVLDKLYSGWVDAIEQVKKKESKGA